MTGKIESTEIDPGSSPRTTVSQPPRKKKVVVNPSNTWTQQPNIKTPEARARAYLVEAGLTPNERQAKNRESLDPTLDLINSPEVKFGRLLASPDQRTRHATIQKLSSYLKARCDTSNTDGGISELDLLKLWKGLWYTLYLCDKVPVQEDVSKKLCQLIWSLAGSEEEDEYAGQLYLDLHEERCDSENCEPEDCMYHAIGEGDADDDDEMDEEDEGNDDEEMNQELHDQDDEENDEDDSDEEFSADEENSLHDDEDSKDDLTMKHCRGAHLASLFIRTFFHTIRREWAKMDKYRIDKFYTAMRFMMHEMYKYMARRHWNLGIIRLFNDAVFEEILSQIPNGPRYHLIDISVDELVKVSVESDLPLTEATFIDCMEPYFALLQMVDDKTVHSRIIEKVLQKFLLEYSVLSDTYLKYAAKSDDKADGDSSTRNLFFDHVHIGTLAAFIFDVASDTSTQDRYRKDLYEVHKQFMRKLKEVGKDVDLNCDDSSTTDESEQGLDRHDPPSLGPSVKKELVNSEKMRGSEKTSRLKSVENVSRPTDHETTVLPKTNEKSNGGKEHGTQIARKDMKPEGKKKIINSEHKHIKTSLHSDESHITDDNKKSAQTDLLESKSIKYHSPIPPIDKSRNGNEAERYKRSEKVSDVGKDKFELKETDKKLVGKTGKNSCVQVSKATTKENKAETVEITNSLETMKNDSAVSEESKVDVIKTLGSRKDNAKANKKDTVGLTVHNASNSKINVTTNHTVDSPTTEKKTADVATPKESKVQIHKPIDVSGSMDEVKKCNHTEGVQDSETLKTKAKKEKVKKNSSNSPIAETKEKKKSASTVFTRKSDDTKPEINGETECDRKNIETTSDARKSKAGTEKATENTEKKTKESAKPNDTDLNGQKVMEKRVKFGRSNTSKSYIASLNDLRKINPQAILKKSPGESILRVKKRPNSETSMSAEKRRKGYQRNRAMDFF